MSLLPIAVALAVAGCLWAVMSLLQPKSNRAAERLDEIRNPTAKAKGQEITGGTTEGMQGLLQKAAPTLSKAVQPKTELEQNKLRVKLANAGYTNPGAPQIFLAVRAVGMGLGLVAAGFCAATMGTDTMIGMMCCGMCAMLGMFGPTIILGSQAKVRIDKIFLQMPDALDMLVVCCEAGLGLDAAMKKVSDEMHEVAPDICDEFKHALTQLHLGTARRDVLHELAVRTGVDDMRRLATVLIQADRFGTGMASALRQQSDEMRTRRKHMAEERAQKVAVKLILPLILFIFPGIFVVLVGPAALLMMSELF